MSIGYYSSYKYRSKGGAKMKGNKKVLVVAVLLLLIAVSYSTYAIYKSSIAGTGTVTAATWNIAFTEGQNTLSDSFTLTFSSSDCVNNSHVANGVIAPGASCTKDITITATGTQVDVEYDVEVDEANITATKNSATVSTSAANDFSATLTDTSGQQLDGEILMSDNPMSETVRVTLSWDDDDDSNANPADVINAADTALNGATITVPITITAKQMIDQQP